MTAREFIRAQLVAAGRPLPMTELTGFDTTDRRYTDASRSIRKLADSGSLVRSWDAAGNCFYALATCDYCGEKPAEGYVSAYDAHVCRECYEDHHGDI